MFPARARTQTARSGAESREPRAEATAPPAAFLVRDLFWRTFLHLPIGPMGSSPFSSSVPWIFGISASVSCSCSLFHACSWTLDTGTARPGPRYNDMRARLWFNRSESLELHLEFITSTIGWDTSDMIWSWNMKVRGIIFCNQVLKIADGFFWKWDTFLSLN